jgi:beta-aspartyl-peptidase (threonine type)
MKPSIIVHGGAWNIPEELEHHHIRGCALAAESGYDILRSGGSAIDAVVQAVVSMEDDPVFDAGTGSVLTQAGSVEMDAIVMDGATLMSGAVGGIQRVSNPVLVARKVLEETAFSLLVGEGALAFARRMGFEDYPVEKLLVGAELEDYLEFTRTGVLRTREEFSGRTDTVGACAIDSQGHVACATSTGGIRRKMAGRVGDSPLVGCGAYADDTVGAASATGWGEKIMAVLLSKAALDRLAAGMSPTEACAGAVEMMEARVSGLGGVIMVDSRGVVGYHHNTPKMAFALVDSMGRTKSAVRA